MSFFIRKLICFFFCLFIFCFFYLFFVIYFCMESFSILFIYWIFRKQNYLNLCDELLFTLFAWELLSSYLLDWWRTQYSKHYDNSNNKDGDNNLYLNNVIIHLRFYFAECWLEILYFLLVVLMAFEGQGCDHLTDPNTYSIPRVEN